MRVVIYAPCYGKYVAGSRKKTQRVFQKQKGEMQQSRRQKKNKSVSAGGRVKEPEPVRKGLKETRQL